MAKDAMVMAISVWTMHWLWRSLLWPVPLPLTLLKCYCVSIEVYESLEHDVFTDSEVAVTRDTVSMAKDAMSYGYISVLRCTSVMAEPIWPGCSTSLPLLKLRLH
ncbi:hypothetical protein CDAR_183321 [Caerostris darwini]|uniref:Uncharacterized protein n=1 Tax=Caerostris darwini TaxID=1538125 RepID=A0AAV4NDI2_9ARAC|nr:hypothetical protein CDAR_183321 [Caerostris darwini]